MAEKLDELRKKIEEKKSASGIKFKTEEKPERSYESVDLDQVERIVDRMKRRYSEEGLEFEQVSGKLAELRGIIAEGKTKKIHIQRPEELVEFKTPAIKAIGSFYLRFQKPLKAVMKFMRRLPMVQELGYYLYSSAMPYSMQQYLAISVSVATIAAIIAFFTTLFGFAVLLEVFIINPLIIVLLPVLLAIIVFFMATSFMFLIPKSRAKARGEAVSSELPFALRHMATELRSGIGLYRTLQAVASSDYGALSEEFRLTISEIEEGTDASDALRHLAVRTQSHSLRVALTHIVRALKTGGNLSEVMNTIAQNVSFELRERTREFAEKMNFFGVIFIFGAIVMPVFVIVLGSIRNAPLGRGGTSMFASLPLDPAMLMLFFIILMPLVLGYFIFFVRSIQPRT